MAVQAGQVDGTTRGGIFQGITNLFGGILGETDAQFAAKQSQNLATTQQASATQYGQQAAGNYSQIGQQGQKQTGIYDNNYLNLLNQYGGMAGLGGNTINTRGGTGAGGNLAQTLNSQPGQGQQQAGPNPYQLDPNQQSMLNQSNAQIAQASKSAQAQFAQHMASSGITDPRALQLGQEQLQEHFQALQQETEAKFYEQVKTDKLAALQQIISGVSQYGQQGIGEQEAAGSGFLGLAQGAQAFAAQNQNVALQQQQANQGALGGLLNLAGFGLGGGFGGGSSSATPAVDPLSNLTGILG